MEKNYTLTIPRIIEQVVDLGRTAWNAQKHSELVSARKKKKRKKEKEKKKLFQTVLTFQVWEF